MERGDANYSIEMPYWIDTDAYSDRDREMFVCGAEFTSLLLLIKSGWTGTRPIHRENESRIRMMCGRIGIQCRIVPQSGYEGCETWSDLTIPVAGATFSS